MRRTRDNVLVVHHNAHLADGRLIRQTDSTDLPPAVPTLADALEACEPMWVNIEIKNHPQDPDYDAEHGISLAVAGLVLAFGMLDRVMVSAFDFDSVRRIRRVDRAIPVAWLVWGQSSPASLIGRAEAHSFNGIHPSDKVVDASFVRMSHAASLEVNVWPVDDPERMLELAEFGVDGIVTNDPALAIATLSEAGWR